MRRQKGFGAIAAIMILVVLAALAAAIVSLGSGQQLASAKDVLSAEAWQVASAGTEDGLFQALKNASCGTTTWASPDYAGFKVTVACIAGNYNDGESAPGVPRVLRVFQVTATACNGTAATCPDDAASAGIGYIERQAVAVAYCEWNGTACVGP